MASKRELELRDAIAGLDDALNEHRFLLDGHARGRRYKDYAEVAAKSATFARQADEKNRELNAILEAEWAARRG